MKIVKPLVVADSSTFTRSSSASYFDSSGKYAEVGNDVLRFSTDPYEVTQGNVSKVALVETSAAANLLSYPRNYDTGWFSTRSTVYPNQAGSELMGGQSFDFLQEQVTSVTDHYTAQFYSGFAAGTTYTFSTIAKTGGRNIALWLEASTFGTTQAVVFDLTTGNGVIAAGSPLFSSKYLGNGDWRVSITATATSTIGSTLILMLGNGASLSYAGDGVSGVYIGHSQLEVGNKATSIIPDNTTFVSRAGSKWAFNSSGVLTSYGTNVSVTDYDPTTLVSKGVSLEAASTNALRINTSAANWQLQNAPNITVVNSGSGTEYGMEYTDIRVSGTALAGVPFNVVFEQNTIVAASVGQVWCGSVFIRKIAGNDLSGGFYLGIDENNSTPAFLTSSRVAVGISSTLNRYYCTRTTTQATIASVNFLLTGTALSTEAVDFTVRLYLPQFENISTTLVGPTSVIKTSGSAVTRAADISTSSSVTRAADVLGTTLPIMVTNVPETDYTAWGSGTAYTTGTYVRYVANNVHKVYVALTNNTNKNPTTNPTDWQDAGSTNAWKMFDQSVQSQTSQTSDIEVNIFLNGNVINNMTLMNVLGTDVYMSMMHPTDGSLYEKTIDLTSFFGVSDWYTYFFSAYTKETDFIFEGMPPYGDATITLKIAANGAATRAVGVAIIGNGSDVSAEKLGVEHSARLSIQDYSVKEQDSFGNYTIVERNFARRADFTVYVEPTDVNGLMQLLASRRATPTLYIGSTEDKYRCTIVYGFYKDFSIEIAYPSYSVCTLQLEGLT